MKVATEQLAGFRRIRKLAGVSQQCLEARTKINRAKLSGFENGHLDLTSDELQRVSATVIAALEARSADLSALVQAVEISS